MNDIVDIRPITQNDTDKILRWRNSNLVMNNFIDRNELTKEIHENWLLNKVGKKEVYQFIAIDKLNNYEFGSTYLKDINKNHRKAELGIFIGEEGYIGKGFGPVIAKKTIEFGFSVLNLNKIYARVLSYNGRSCSMFKKMGFSEDALLREDVIINNQVHDVYIFSILRKEWKS